MISTKGELSMIVVPAKKHALKEHSMKMKWNFNLIKCCYEKLKCKEEGISYDFEGCMFVTKPVYDNIKQNIKIMKSYCSKVEINCSGTSLSFIYFVFISLFFL